MSQFLPIPLGVFWEEISERSIQRKKPVGATKSKGQPQTDSGADPTFVVSVEKDDAREPEEVRMIEAPWMQPYLAYLIYKEFPENQIEAR
jgi:hypothetical protein